ncbi:glycoside hydrolase family 16 protein [Russula ochroleuca]|uniref:Glycoside hydrolase family 16 protein n=1 Tax=Russula ochroleuca TaxID=152965 RepID=A0A9P5JXP0_9AGAM|nr:glycoside hydrolase family 16 protein [Russula ochroleuca]
MSAHSSLSNSAVDLQQRHSVTPREAFSSPRPRPLTVVYASGNQGTRSRLSRRKRPASTMLSGELTKPWVGKKDKAARISYFVTYSMLLLGIAATAVRCYTGWRSVSMIGKLCLVLEDEFNGNDLDASVWMHEVDLGGFGNGEFEMTTASSNNSFIRDGELYILPTLTSDVIGRDGIFDGHTFNLTGCTNTNLTACGAVSNARSGAVINPAMSARISTKGKRSIRYGKVEVRAKLPRGDWLWPAIWMLPENNTYGPWPLSGEIDIMEARGNGPTYPAQGTNYVRGSLNWGPLTWLNAVSKTYGWWTVRRSTYADTFHTYGLEWTEDFLRIYVDNRLQHMLDLRFDVPFFQRGKFPTSVANASQEIILPNPWAGRGNSAPFDQPFYLILDVAVGGTNGWFPDGAGNKPWLNGAINAMQLFAQSQDKWSETWPESDDRAMRIDYVKMWEQC